jgi:uncharacterized membrane protein
LPASRPSGGTSGAVIRPPAVSASGHRASHRASPGGQRRVVRAATGSSPVSSVLAAATGREVGGGFGIFLPVLVLAGVIGVAVGALRRRRPSGST